MEALFAAQADLHRQMSQQLANQEPGRRPERVSGGTLCLGCSGISVCSLAVLACIASVPMLVIGAIKWSKALPGSRDMAVGKLLVGLALGLGWGLSSVGSVFLATGGLKHAMENIEATR